MPWSVTLLGGRHASAPAVCGNVPDSLYLFTINRERHLMLRRFDGRWNPWTVVSTQALGEGAPAAIVLGRAAIEAGAGAHVDADPTAQQRARAARDLVHVFARGANDHVQHLVYVHGRGGAWTDLGGETHFPPAVCAPAPADLMLFVTALGGGIRTRRFHEGSWQPWASLDGPPGGSDAGLGLSADRETGQINLAARSPTGLWSRRYHRGRGWGGWHQVPGQELGQVAAVTRGERVNLFARDAGARLAHDWLERDWHGWERVNDVVLSSHPSAFAAGGALYVAALGRHDQARLFQPIASAPAGRAALFLDVGDDGNEKEVDDDLEDDQDSTSLVSNTSGSGSPGDPPITDPPITDFGSGDEGGE